MKTILLSLALLASLSFAHDGGNGKHRNDKKIRSVEMTENEKIERSKKGLKSDCYLVCENGEVVVRTSSNSPCLEIKKNEQDSQVLKTCGK